jgi:hypothetical protein
MFNSQISLLQHQALTLAVPGIVVVVVVFDVMN